MLDLKPPPTRQPDFREKDDYTDKYARKRKNASNLLLIYPTTDVPHGGQGRRRQAGNLRLSPALIP